MQPSVRSTPETIERAEDGHSVDDRRERDRLSEEVSGRHEEGEHRQPDAIRDGRERDTGSEPHEVRPPVAEHGALPEVEGERRSEGDEEAGEVRLVGPGAEEPDETDGNHHLQGPPRAHVERIAEVRHPGDEDGSDDGRPEGHRDRRRGRDRCRGRADHDEFRDSGRRVTGDEGPKVVPDAACRLRREVIHDADHEDSQEGAGRDPAGPRDTSMGERREQHGGTEQEPQRPRDGIAAMVRDGQAVAAEALLFEWDLYNNPIVTQHSGTVRFQDVKEKVTVREEVVRARPGKGARHTLWFGSKGAPRRD